MAAGHSRGTPRRRSARRLHAGGHVKVLLADDHRLIIEGVKRDFRVDSVVMTRKPFSSKPATDAILDQLAKEADLVVSAMAD